MILEGLQIVNTGITGYSNDLRDEREAGSLKITISVAYRSSLTYFTKTSSICFTRKRR